MWKANRQGRTMPLEGSSEMVRCTFLKIEVTYLPTTSSAAYIDAPNAASTQTYGSMLKLEGQHEPPDHAPPAEY